MRTPKILILTPGLGRGGAQKIFKDQTRFYSKHFDVTSCIFNWDDALEEEKNFVVLSLDVPAGKHWISKFYFFCKRVIKVRAIRRKNKFDISISHLEGADYVNILSRQGEKVICYIHGTKFQDGAIRGFLGWLRKNLFMPVLYRKADLIISVSTGIQSEFSNGFKIPMNKISVITNGVDVEKISQQAREAIQVGFQELLQEHKTICLCSRLAPQKNQVVFLSIFAELRKSVKCKLIILGDGELRNALIRQSNQLGLQVYHRWDTLSFSKDFDVYFFGNLANPFPYISRSSLFALPSSWEGFPLALCEAMACGVPVIASDCPTGPKEILIDEESNAEYGFLLPIPIQGDEKGLQKWTSTITAILKDDALSKEYAEKAKLRVKGFGKENMEAAWLKLVNV